MLSPLSGVQSIQQYALYRSAPAQPGAPVAPVTPAAPASPVSSSASARRVGLSAALYPQGASAPAQTSAASVPGASAPGVYQEIPGDPASLARRATLPQAYPAELAARMRTVYPQDQPGQAVETDAALGAEGAQKAADEGRCETCEKRKYQDGSDDISVSYQTPTKIDPDAAPAAVRGHEMEHVYHEQAKAQREGRKVVSQTVTLHTDICPECGRVYISGGTTRTVTKGESSETQPAQEAANPQEDGQ